MTKGRTDITGAGKNAKATGTAKRRSGRRNWHTRGPSGSLRRRLHLDESD